MDQKQLPPSDTRLLPPPHEDDVLRAPADGYTARPRWHFPLWLIVALLVILLLAAWGIFSRLHAHGELRKKTESESIPSVTIVHPTTGGAAQDLTLPGNVQAFIDAPIYARTSGYLSSWTVDIGAKVKAGQLLGVIDAPEVDQQLDQAEADLATTKANSNLSEITAKRYQTLLKTDAVSRQEADQTASDAAAKRAQVASAAANVKRLHDLKSFEKIYAPFDGVLTERNTDIGQLINAGNNSGHELFRVASVTKLRTYIQVPQSQGPFVKPGVMAELHFAEHPGKTYPGKVVRTANSIDPTSRTLLTEVQVDNAAGELIPGSYSEVHLQLPSDATTGAVRVPANTLIFRSSGMQIAVLAQDNKVSLRPAMIGRDFGNEVEIVSGLTAQDSVVLNPPDSLADGQQVNIAPPADQKATASQSGQANSDEKDKDKNKEKSDDKKPTTSRDGAMSSTKPDKPDNSGSSGGSDAGSGGSTSGSKTESGQTAPGTNGNAKK